MKKFLSLAVIALALSSATSCARRDSGPDIPRAEARALEAAKAPAQILDRDLRNRVASDTFSRERLEDGRLATAVSVRNRTRRPIHIQTRVVYKDINGISLGDETAWEHVYLAPRQTITMRHTSMVNNAELFTLEIRQPYQRPIRYRR